MYFFPLPHAAATISQSGINIALLGKGVCTSQACFLRDLLITSGEKAITRQEPFVGESGFIENLHLVTYTSQPNGNSLFFLDPTWYTGMINSIEGSFNSASIPDSIKNQVSQFDITQEDIETSRDIVQEYLIERFQIRDISSQLGIPEVDDLDKQIRILTFMEKNLAPASEALLCRSVVLGDREIECGKLLELFYKANNIPYELKCSGDKYNSSYITTIGGLQSTLYPKYAYLNADNKNPLSRRLHFAINEKGENKYLWDFSDENLQRFTTSIKESRKIADTVIIPEQKLNSGLPVSNKQFINTLKIDNVTSKITDNRPAAAKQKVIDDDDEIEL